MRTGNDLQINGLLESIKTSDKDRNKKKVHFKLEDEKDETFVTNSETDMSIESDLESSIEGPESLAVLNPQTKQGSGREAGKMEGCAAKYHCDTCNQSYSRQDNLLRHKRLAHGELLI